MSRCGDTDQKWWRKFLHILGGEGWGQPAVNLGWKRIPMPGTAYHEERGICAFAASCPTPREVGENATGLDLDLPTTAHPLWLNREMCTRRVQLPCAPMWAAAPLDCRVVLGSIWARVSALNLDCTPPGSCVHGILQARVLKWVVISFSRGPSPPRDLTPHPANLLHWQADSLPLSHLGSPRVYILIS